jgi:urea transport system permease protein
MLSRGGWRIAGLLLTSFIIAGAAAAQPNDEAFRTTLGALREASYVDKERLAKDIIAAGHPGAQRTLAALRDNRLYVSNDTGAVVIVENADNGLPAWTLDDPATGRRTGQAPADQLTRIGTNNRLRRALRIELARFALSSGDGAVRLAAVRDLNRSLDDSTVELLTARRATEHDSRVLAEIDTGVAIAALADSDVARRLQAVELLGTRVSADARNRLAALLERGPDGAFTEPDASVRRAAENAVRRIDSRRSFYSGIETLFFGLSLGSVLVLAAIGLAITFGVMGVINMAHGELMMLGAYTVYVVQRLMPNYVGMSILVAVPTAFLVAGAAGVVIERSIIRFLYGRQLETLLATFGVSLVLQQLVRSVFSANNRAVETPGWLSGTLQVNDALSLTYNRLYIVGFTVAVFAALLVALKRTRLGLDIRAISQNRSMARAMGVRSSWIDALTFGLGSGIAGVAGVALSQLTNVGPNLGQSYIIDSFMVVVFGGVGNLWGTFIGGMSMGIVNKLLEPYTGAVLSKIVVLVALILFIQRRPRGLFPQVGRAAGD